MKKKKIIIPMAIAITVCVLVVVIKKTGKKTQKNTITHNFSKTEKIKKNTLPELTLRQKHIIPIAALTATGEIPKLERALNEGINKGLTVNEVKEILIQSYAYAGFPRALNGINAYMRVMEKRKAAGIHDIQGKEPTALPDNFDKKIFGNKTRNFLVGRDISNRTSGYPVFTPIIDQYLLEHLFADIFYRDTLSFQDRELITISILAAMTGTEAQLKTHLGISQRMGLSTQQLENFIIVLNKNVSTQSSQRAAKALYLILNKSTIIKKKYSVSIIRKKVPTRGSNKYFTGSAAISSRFSNKITDSYRGGIVNFKAEARTAWHKHPFGQTLVVISGRGLVQSDGDTVQKISPYDVVWIPANTKHWHGASKNSHMSHVAISEPENGTTVEWMEQVSQKQYNNLNK